MSVGSDGRVLLYCHARCEAKAIVAAIGLSMSDLFDAPVAAKPRARQVATYDYTDEEGRLLYQVVRYEPKTFKFRRPGLGGKWEWSVKGTRRVLYRLPAILDAVRAGGTIHICAGEKDADAANAADPDAISYVATTVPGGEGRKRWKPEFTEALTGAARVIVWRDPDPAGHAHVIEIKAALAPVVRELRIVRAKDGKDAHDHLAAGHALDEAVDVTGEHLTEPEEGGSEGGASEAPELLIPGGHVADDGVYTEIGNDDFVRGAIDALPPDALYRRGTLVGTIDGEVGSKAFEEAGEDRLRIIIDSRLRLVRWSKARKASDFPQKIFVPAAVDHARLIRAGASIDPKVRCLDLLTSYPVVMGADCSLVTPGWNEGRGAFYDEPSSLHGIVPIRGIERIHEVLDDLVVDFPFKDEASRENFFGLMLTPLIRTAIPDANIPLHMVMASLERTGKGKLATETLGGVILGRTSPVMPWAGSEEERDKRVTALLKRGDTLAVIDNLDANLSFDSAVLAALLTSRRYTGRVLGKSEMVDLPNTLTLVATGNNVRCSGEIAKRTIPIILQPKTDHPEARNDFKHPDLVEHVRSVRVPLLAALIGMIENWKPSRLAHDRPMGGFDAWSRMCGGILRVNGYSGWRTNFEAWVRHADPEGEDLRAFVAAWADRWPDEKKSTAELLKLVDDLGVFPWVQKAKTDGGKAVSLAKTVLRKSENRPVGKWLIRASGSGSTSLYYLEECQL
jgi:hypothetical protein